VVFFVRFRVEGVSRDADADAGVDTAFGMCNFPTRSLILSTAFYYYYDSWYERTCFSHATCAAALHTSSGFPYKAPIAVSSKSLTLWTLLAIGRHGVYCIYT
jgi:hypothetical protein